MKKTGSLVLALLMAAVVFVGCTASTPATSSASAPAAPAGQATAPPLRIAVEVKATETDFWQYMLIGAEQYAKAYPDRVKVTTYGPTKETDIDIAQSILEQIIETKPDGIVIASISADANVPAMEKAYGQGIIVVTVDNKMNTNEYNAFLATDHFASGALAADALVEGMRKKGVMKGMILMVTPSGEVASARIKGFEEQMAVKYPEYSIYPNIPLIESDIAGAMVSLCENVLSENKDIVGVYDVADYGNGVIEYFEKAKIGEKVTVVCFDADPEKIQALKAGCLYAIITQDPAGFGYKGVDLVYQIKVNGYKLEEDYPDKYISTGCTKITAENVNDPALAGLIDPYRLRDGTATRDWD